MADDRTNGRAERPEPAAGPVPDVAALVADAARGDEDAWRRLVHAFGPRVFALVRSRTGDPEFAEEVTQAVFAKVSEKLVAGSRGYLEQGRFESWLFRIAMNRVRDEARRRSTRRDAQRALQHERAAHAQPAAERVAGPGGGPEAALAEDRADAIGRVRRALEHLNDADREVVELRHHGGLSFKQIAELLDQPVGTLLARHHRALKKLRETMEAAAATAAPDHSDALRPQRKAAS